MSTALVTGLVIGVVIGVVYALIAAVLVFVYEATGVLNFAVGAFAMVAAYTFDSLAQSIAPLLAWLVISIASLPIGAAIGVATLPAQRATREVKATASIAAVVAAQGLVLLIWGTNPRSPISVVSGTAFTVSGVTVTWERVLAAAIAVVGCLALSFFLRVTRTGSAIRATASDNDVARLIGLSVQRLWVLAWIISTFAIAVVIVVILPDVGLSTDQLSFIVLTPLAAVLLARFRSVPVAALVALLLGLVEGVFSGVTALAPYQQVCPLAAVLLALILPGVRASLRQALDSRPRGGLLSANAGKRQVPRPIANLDANGVESPPPGSIARG